MSAPTLPLSEMKVALVTGASQGLGRALATELAEAGLAVALVARHAAPLEAAAAALRAAGHTALAVPADVGDPDAAARVVGQVTAALGPIDVLVHNASTLGPVPLRPLLDLTDADVRAVLEVNVLGPFRLTRLVAGQMALRGRGLVVHVSSDAAVEAYPTWGAYGLSKAALDHLGRTWAAELGDRGVRVVALDPGEMDTAMHAAAIPDADRAALGQPADVARRLLHHAARLPTGTRAALSSLRSL